MAHRPTGAVSQPTEGVAVKPFPPALWRRRQVWLPTVWGWLALGLAGAAVLLGHGRAAHGWLAPNELARGADGRGARTLVVEGWMDEAELAQAIDAFRRGRYERVLTTGGPIDAWSDVGGWHTYAARGAAYLRAHGLAQVPIAAVPAPASRQERTYVGALKLREWSHAAGVPLQAIDLVSAGVHARRSRLLYRMALGRDVEVGVIAAAPQDFDAERWWTSSGGAKAVLGEAVSLAWTACCFWPTAPP